MFSITLGYVILWWVVKNTLAVKRTTKLPSNEEKEKDGEAIIFSYKAFKCDITNVLNMQ